MRKISCRIGFAASRTANDVDAPEHISFLTLCVRGAVRRDRLNQWFGVNFLFHAKILQRYPSTLNDLFPHDNPTLSKNGRAVTLTSERK
jgi:hypothetical protein